MKQVIGIFGSNGYLGSEVVSLCEELSLPYVKLEREVANNDREILSRVSIVIDCGFPRDYFIKNVAQRYLLEINHRARIFESLSNRYLYLATYSGIVTRETRYSKLKFDAELILKRINATCLRLGLVTSENSPGGRFLELKDLVEKLPLLILPSRSWYPVLTCTSENLKISISHFLTEPLSFHPPESEFKPLSILMCEMNPSARKFYLPGLLTGLLAVFVRLLPFKRIEGIKAISVSQSFAKSRLISDRAVNSLNKRLRFKDD